MSGARSIPFDDQPSLREKLINQGKPERSLTIETPKRRAPGSRELATIIAISIVAFALANLLHEGAGHGGACVLTGGHAKVLSSVHFECDRDSRFISAGGTLLNFIVGLLSWFALQFVTHARDRLRYFLWLLMTINLLQVGGYFLFQV